MIRSGVLPAGERAEIQLLYSPSFDEKLSLKQSGKTSVNEEHYLRVVLQIVNGKPLALNLKGMTLAPMKGLLAIKKSHYTFPNVPIGSLLPAIYPIEMQNVGSGKVTYKADVSALSGPSEIKGSQKLLDIQNPSKTLNPGEKAYLYCLFKPSEAKRYDFELPIQVSDFVSVIQELKVTLTGSGYNLKPNKYDHAHHEEIPTQRSFVSQLGSKVFFSIEELDFGEVESQKPQYRLILLYNAHKSRRLTYDFFKTGLVWY